MCNCAELRVDDIIKKYNITKSKIYSIAKYMNIPKNQYGSYVFPLDFELPYLPDGRKFKKNALGNEYIYVIDLIHSGLACCYGFLGLTESKVRTCVRELKKIGVITLLDGCEETSLNYRDYMLSPSCSDWYDRSWNKKKEMIAVITTSLAFGVTTAVNN